MRAVFVALALFALGCGSTPLPAPPPPARPPAIVPGPATLAIAWQAPFDSQSALVLLGDRIVESGWRGIAFHSVDDGRETARYAGEESRFRAWIHDGNAVVLVAMDDFAIARGREPVVARFDRDALAPRWVVPSCPRLYAVAGADDRIFALCDTGLVRIDASSGAVLGTAPVTASAWHDEHAVVAIAHGAALRAGTTVLAFDTDGTERFRRALEGSFGLARSDEGLVVASVTEGLVVLSERTGETVRTIALGELGASPDLFTMRLGRVVVDGDLAIVEAGGRLRAVSLGQTTPAWSAVGAGAVLDAGAVHACAGGRLVALDRQTGRVLFSWSAGECTVLGVSNGTVIAWFGAAGPTVTADEAVHQGLVAFRPSDREVPCEAMTVRGVVRVNGALAPGVRVRAGAPWAIHADGTVSGWGARTPPLPPASGSAVTPASGSVVTTTTDASGAYTLALCDLGHVPIVVDPDDAERVAGETHARGIAAFVHLDGRGSYTLDLDVHVSGPEL